MAIIVGMTPREQEIAEIRAKMASATRGEREMMVYTSREEAYADLFPEQHD
jgi:hypothetical protein